MRFAVYPYKMGSQSAANLASALQSKQIKHEGSKFKNWNNKNYWVINWGSSHCPTGHSVLNPSINSVRASDKLRFFELVKDYCRVPEFSTSREVARAWFDARGTKYVVCRTSLAGHSGQGIVLAENKDGVVVAPLYTRYVPKDTEYRLHFIAGSSAPFFVQRKARRVEGFEGKHNSQIRNLAGGYVYVHDAANVGTVPADVVKQATDAFKQSHLDFGAMDVIYNQKSGKAYVLEVNTAPGLEGETILAYASAFKSLRKPA